ncbi:hypothetical protein [Paenibacillus methanolicus]|uniref:Uncharacterized protein n=1 Tax=Paenibacillus methanolicus TaxID=582686 RepID=A0A5S5BXK8_9BACL|nr:hypothetical protein [Paenibacillus methanolicus]TYP71767.1 hypothetical protein BCM02_10945 [Paenibacillus methanolicus]
MITCEQCGRTRGDGAAPGTSWICADCRVESGQPGDANKDDA